MKGQAFVTFPSVELATRAMGEVHGYMLHEKPLVLEFARSEKAGKENAEKEKKSS